MHARFVRLSSAAAAVAATTFVFGSPVAQAADGDAEFLATLAGLGIEFATPDEAVAAGNNICDIALVIGFSRKLQGIDADWVERLIQAERGDGT